MISIKILHSPDENKISTFTFEFDSISIGSRKKCDIYIKDQIIGKLILHFEVKGQSAIVRNNDSDLFYYINGKKISGSKLIKIGDHIKIGKTQLILESCTETWLQEKEDITNFLKEVYTKEPQYKRLYDILEKEIIMATQGSHAEK